MPARAANDDTPNGFVRGTKDYRRLAAALLMAGFSTFALLYAAQPLLTIFSQSFAISAANASLAVSLSTGAMALSFIPAGILSDRIGRRPVMIGSLFASSIFTIASCIVTDWTAQLVLRTLIGVALAGVPSVAMAYIAEEVDHDSLGSAMGVYIAGSAIGGMAGRIGVTWLSEFLGWQAAIAAAGLIGVCAGTIFLFSAPQSRGFSTTHHNLSSLAAATRRLFADRALPWLYLEGCLLLGTFVTIFNYLGFHLEQPPYSLSRAAIGSIFFLYIIGSYSSAWFGGLASRYGRDRLLWMPVAAMAVGISLTEARDLVLIVLGVGIVTGGLFAAHSTASGWVGERATRDRALAAAFYLLFYYMGSSLFGAVGGLALDAFGWTGVASYCLALAIAAVAVALRLRAISASRRNE